MIRKALLVAAVAASASLAGCGGTSRTRTFTGGMSSANWATHADAVTLLPFANDLRAVIRPTSRPNRNDQAVNAGTLNSAFGPSTSRAMKLLSGAAELTLTGASGAQLYLQLFEFRTLAGARSLTRTFLATTRLHHAGLPAGGAGEQRLASSQPYGRGNLSYRFAFREQNVLVEVELDGSRRRYARADVLRVATLADRHIATALNP